MNPFKFIFSPKVGHKAQDLLNMDSIASEGYQFVLRYADHLSRFSHIALLKQRETTEVGQRVRT
jgi:hypothetical protein